MNARETGSELLTRVLGLHPLSAFLAVAVDWLLFGSNAMGLGMGFGLALLLAIPLGSVVANLQMRRFGDTTSTATLKGIAVAALVCIPTPIFSAPVVLSGLLGGLAGRSSRTETH